MEMSELICCPACRGDLKPHDRRGGAGLPFAGSARYSCDGCDREYPVVEGVLDFLPAPADRGTIGQWLMEADFMVRLYEGSWYRASGWATRVMKISLDDEVSLIRQILELGEADAVLDLACGPGLYARRLAEGHPERRVLGLDISWPMLRYGSRTAATAGMRNIGFTHGDAHSLPIRDECLAGAVCCGAMHLFPDVRRVLAELRRVIRPGGRLGAGVALRGPGGLRERLRSIGAGLIGVHPFGREEFEALLDEAGFEPAVHHAAGVWMVAGGLRRP